MLAKAEPNGNPIATLTFKTTHLQMLAKAEPNGNPIATLSTSKIYFLT